ncbi:MAG: TetR family transcriptional regulator [Corynebacterium sp.]|uniref:TetR family transcriptional regulator n=1 Tax=Corynebacterium sp. TaxID=1720 RepID=UPI0026DEBC5B|nr:TetR family transcriptional regulator [Corynebacterium sp.]MDO5669909.1 TetR family transcriptional regulator [Corynebacterium sp.]
MIPRLSPEQLLLIADEFCTTHGTQVQDFGALVAAAAVPGARIAGIPVHDNSSAAADSLAAAVSALRPLTARNELFAAACRAVYVRLSA